MDDLREAEPKTPLGKRLRQVSKEFFKNQAEMAGFLGLSQQRMSQSILEAKRPDPELLARLYSRGVNLNWLLTGRGSPRLVPELMAQDARERFEEVEKVLRSAAREMEALGGQCRRARVNLDPSGGDKK